jgi:hypothetical protein
MSEDKFLLTIWGSFLGFMVLLVVATVVFMPAHHMRDEQQQHRPHVTVFCAVPAQEGK